MHSWIGRSEVIFFPLRTQLKMSPPGGSAAAL
jgi:hypothetical protein